MIAPWNVFDLRANYAFYGAYHSDATNRALHLVCVWPILFSFNLLQQMTTPLAPWPFAPVALPGGGFLSLNWAFVLSVLYSAYYVILDRRAGTLAAALIAGIFLSTNALLQALGSSVAWKIGVAVNLFGYIVQFVGHGKYENRAPALFDNLAQAFLMAPFFVLLEVLHDTFGYEPEPGFWKAVKGDIDVHIANFRSSKAKAKSS